MNPSSEPKATHHETHSFYHPNWEKANKNADGQDRTQQRRHANECDLLRTSAKVHDDAAILLRLQPEEVEVDPGIHAILGIDIVGFPRRNPPENSVILRRDDGDVVEPAFLAGVLLDAEKDSKAIRALRN